MYQGCYKQSRFTFENTICRAHLYAHQSQSYDDWGVKRNDMDKYRLNQIILAIDYRALILMI